MADEPVSKDVLVTWRAMQDWEKSPEREKFRHSHPTYDPLGVKADVDEREQGILDRMDGEFLDKGGAYVEKRKSELTARIAKDPELLDAIRQQYLQSNGKVEAQGVHAPGNWISPQPDLPKGEGLGSSGPARPK